MRTIQAIAVTVLVATLGSNPVRAATLWWDADSATGLQAGNGTWDLTPNTAGRAWCSRSTGNDANYSRVSWGANNSASVLANNPGDAKNWNGSDAIFLTSGTSIVTVDDTAGQVNVNSMTFSGTGYTIAGATLTMLGPAITCSQDATISAPLAGTVGLTKSGAATLILSGANGYSGTTTISAGTLQIGAGAAAGTLGTDGVTDNAALVFNRSDAVTVGNVISGSGSLTQAGGGTLILTGGNSYGVTVISAGTLQIGNGSTTGTLGTGNVTNNTALVFNRSDAVTVGNAISGSGSLTKAGAGTVLLTGANSYNGGTTVSNGVLRMGAAGAIAANSALTVQGGAFDMNSYTLTLSSLSGNGGSITNAGLTVNQSATTAYAGNIAGTGSLVKAGSGVLTLSGANSYGGGTTVSNGVLRMGAAGAIAANSALAVQGGAFDMNGYLLTLSSLSGNGGSITNAGLTVNQSAITAYAGNIAGTGSLVKTGSGTLTLSGANGYSGMTTIGNGTLALGAAGSITNSKVISVSGGAKLDLTAVPGAYALVRTQILTNNGTVSGGLVISAGARVIGGGFFAGPVTNKTGGFLTPGTGGHTNIFASTLTLSVGSTNSFWIQNPVSHDMSVVSNGLFAGSTGASGLLQMDLTSYNAAAETNAVIVLYDNIGSSTFDGTNSWLVLSDTGPNNGMALKNDSAFFALGGSNVLDSFTIHYDYNLNTETFGNGNSIVLTVIPEPATVSMMLFIGAGLVLRRRMLRK